MLAPLLVGFALMGPKPFDYYSMGSYDSSVPRPESILGYAPGDRHTNFRDQERVILGIAAAARDRVKIIEYGKTPEGRPLRVLAISSPKNIARLNAIQEEHRLIAQGQGNPSKTVPIVWINECIHGDETASFESGMWTLYNLAAARGGQVAKALENEVVMLNPVFNPDGHERYVVYYTSLATGSSDPFAFEGSQPGTVYGRLNHYRFDMNRDRVAFSQDEVKEEFAEVLKWGPQVYVDQHGQVNSYFFPPEPMAINPNVDRARNAKWTNIFGRATGAAFDSAGFGYFTKDEFDLWYPGYTDSANTLSGAIGMTHETDGGRRIASQREDGSVLTLRRGMDKHFLSALTVVEAAAANAAPLMADYAKFKHNACDGSFAGKFQRVVMTSPDPRPLRRLQKQLASAGVESKLVSPFKQSDAHDYWGTANGAVSFDGNVLVVDMAQSQGPMAKALLEPTTEFEPEFIKAQTGKKKTAPDGENYPGPEGAEFYDMTGWALPYAYCVHAWWCESAPAVSPIVEPMHIARPNLTPNSIGYALPYNDEEDALTAMAALNAGLRVSVSTKPMTVGTKVFDRGTFLILADRNDDGYEKKLSEVLAGRSSTVVPLVSSYPDGDRESPGSGSVSTLRNPKIALVMGNGTNLAQSGAAWFLLERTWKVPFTPISWDALSRGDLGRFTAIVVPPGVGGSVPSKLREWISAGGHLVMLDAPSWALGKDSLADLTSGKDEVQDLPGTLFRAEIDPRSHLSYGYGSSAKIEISVPVSGSTFYKVRKEGGSVVTLSADEKTNKLLSGWEWPDESEKALRGTVFAQDTPIGEGHAIVFTQDPTDRAMWPGLNKLILNAILFGR